MANRIIGNGNTGAYTFAAASKKVTITGVNNLQLFQILNITNLTQGVIIYNPFVSGAGYTAYSNGELTLQYDTTSHSSSDVLLITYNNEDAAQQQMVDLSLDIRNLYAAIANPIYAENGGVKLNANSTLATITTVTTVSTVTNITNIGGLSAEMALTAHLMGQEFQQVRNLIT